MLFRSLHAAASAIEHHHPRCAPLRRFLRHQFDRKLEIEIVGLHPRIIHIRIPCPTIRYYNSRVARPPSHRLGRRSEWAALLLLLAKGYRFRHRNWRGAGGELDLMMQRREEMVFVEVKARSDALYGGAVAAFDKKKQQVLVRVSAAYLSRYSLWERPCRFDLITVERVGGMLPWRIRHYRDVFQPNRGRQF